MFGYAAAMPFKHHAAQRHRIAKARYRVRNWPAYETGLARRGDLTFWLDEAALAGWRAPRRTTPGGQARYSDLAIELVLTLRLVFHLALRQAAAFAASVLRLFGAELPVPDHATLSRRGRALAGRQPRAAAGGGPVHLVLDSTGLQLLARASGTPRGTAARSGGGSSCIWRSMPTGEIAAHLLTEGTADDAAQVPDLLGQAEGMIASVTADGAYDGEPTYAAVTARQPDPPPDVVVPPRVSAVPSTEDPAKQNSRDRYIRLIAEKGRMAWQKATGYGRRSLGKTAMGRYKRLIGPKLRARGLPAQQGEVTLAVRTLNRMIRIAKPVSVRAA